MKTDDPSVLPNPLAEPTKPNSLSFKLRVAFITFDAEDNKPDELLIADSTDTKHAQRNIRFPRDCVIRFGF